MICKYQSQDDFFFCDCVSFFLFFPSFRLHRLSLPSSLPPSRVLRLARAQELATFKEAWRKNEARLSAEREKVEAIAAALAAKKEAFVAMQAAAVKELDGREALVAEREAAADALAGALKRDAALLEDRVAAARGEAAAAAQAAAEAAAAEERLEGEKARVTEIGMQMQTLSESMAQKVGGCCFVLRSSLYFASCSFALALFFLTPF
jgi:hypothetical protein